MPMYDYKCECGEKETLVCKMSEKPELKTCGKCGKKMVQEVGTYSFRMDTSFRK